MTRTRGVPEVPLGLAPALQAHLQDVREVLLQLRATQAPPSVPQNVQVTPQAFGNTLQWSRSVNADYYEVLHSTTPNIANATVVNVGNSASYTDTVGKNGIQKWYWIRAHKLTGPRSLETMPVSATTLASGTAVTPPTPPPSSRVIVQNQQFNRKEPQDPRAPR